MHTIKFLLLVHILFSTVMAQGAPADTVPQRAVRVVRADTVPDLSGTLDSLVVTAAGNTRDAVTETITVTSAMRKGTNSAISLLGNVPGIVLDRMSETINVGIERDVPILVDGKEASPDYARSINPERVYKVEILRHPSGRFADYPAVVNLILKTVYRGYDVNVRGKGLLSLRNSHSDREEAGAGAAYSSERWNVYTDLGYSRRDMYEARAYVREFGDALREETHPADDRHPNVNDRRDTYTGFAGVDCRLSPGHTLSAQGWISAASDRSYGKYSFTGSDAWSRTQGRFRSTEASGGLFYTGRPSERLTVNAEGYYDHYRNREDYAYMESGDGTPSLTPTLGRKGFARGDANATLALRDNLSIRLDEMFTYRRYTVDDRDSGEETYRSDERRNRLDANISWSASGRLHLNAGMALLTVSGSYRSGGDRRSATHWSPLPYARLRWGFAKDLALNVNYFYDVTYPRLDLLAPVRRVTGQHTASEGNPALRPQEMHYLQTELAFRGMLRLTYLARFARRETSRWWYADGGRIIDTYVNSDQDFNYLSLEGDFTIAGLIGLNVTASHQWYARKGDDGTRRRGRVWYLDAQAACPVRPLGMSVMAMYTLRHEKEPLLQGMRYSQQEQLAVGLSRNFMSGRLAVSLFATIPVSAIPKTAWESVEIPGYRYTSYVNDRVNQAVLLLNARLMLGNRKSKSRSKALELEQEKD